jgi:hypothetical protein
MFGRTDVPASGEAGGKQGCITKYFQPLAMHTTQAIALLETA